MVGGLRRQGVGPRSGAPRPFRPGQRTALAPGIQALLRPLPGRQQRIHRQLAAVQQHATDDLDNVNPGEPQRRLQRHQQQRHQQQRQPNPAEQRQTQLKSEACPDDTADACRQVTAGPVQGEQRGQTAEHHHRAGGAQGEALPGPLEVAPLDQAQAEEHQHKRNAVGDTAEQIQQNIGGVGTAAADQIAHLTVGAGVAPGGIER